VVFLCVVGCVCVGGGGGGGVCVCMCVCVCEAGGRRGLGVWEGVESLLLPHDFRGQKKYIV